MNTKVIIHDSLTGGVNITVPAPAMFDPNSSTRKGLEKEGIVFSSDTEILQFIIDRDIPVNVGPPPAIIERINVFSDRYFRNAWKRSGPNINVDLPQAIEIQIDKLRLKRKERFETLDANFMKALEDNDTVAQDAVKVEKNKLRDMPTTVRGRGITSLEILKGFTLEDL